MRVAAVDIGTNSVLLLVVERDASGELLPLVERATITRLGEGVDRTRRLAPRAIERTLDCLADYAGILRQLGVERLDVVGTSAMRDASGGDELIDRASEVLGARPRVISGEEEARLTFAGAVGGLGVLGKVTVLDVGGGSTEIVRGEVGAGHASIVCAHSFDIGSVRLFERFVSHDPPLDDELSAAERLVEEQFRAIPPPSPDEPLVGIAGTVTTIAAIARGIHPYDGSRVHGMRLQRAEVLETARKLAALPFAERLSIPGLEPQRADVIVTGASIVKAALAWSQSTEIVVSDRGVRWGLVEELAHAG